MLRAGAPAATVSTLCACLAACSAVTPERAKPSPPSPTVRFEASAPAEDPVATFEVQLLARAARLEREDRLPEAVLTWQALVLLRPEHAERAAALAKRIEALVAQRLEAARVARANGDLNTSEQRYLSVLALQPGHAEAAASLRSIESARVRREALGQPSRLVLARRTTPPLGAKPASPIVSAIDAQAVELLAMLDGRADLDRDISALERRVAANSRDAEARHSLAELLFKRAQTLQFDQPAAARVALQRCLRLDSGHAQAQALLKQLRAPPAKTPAVATPSR